MSVLSKCNQIVFLFPTSNNCLPSDYYSHSNEQMSHNQLEKISYI